MGAKNNKSDKPKQTFSYYKISKGTKPINTKK